MYASYGATYLAWSSGASARTGTSLFEWFEPSAQAMQRARPGNRRDGRLPFADVTCPTAYRLKEAAFRNM